MNNHKELINFNEAFGYGYQVLQKSWVFLLQIGFLYFLVTLPFSVINSLSRGHHHFSGPESIILGLLQILYWIVTFTLMFNLTKIKLNMLHGKKPTASQLFELPTMQTLRYAATYIIYCLMVIIGTIAFIVPGIYFALKYYYATTLVVDKNMDILEAGQRSAEMMKGEKWQMFAFLLVLCICMIGIVVAGFIFLIVGIFPALFIAFVISEFATLKVYKKLSHK